MVDVSKPVGQESQVIYAPNYVHTFDFIPCIWSRSIDKG